MDLIFDVLPAALVSFFLKCAIMREPEYLAVIALSISFILFLLYWIYDMKTLLCQARLFLSFHILQISDHPIKKV